MYPSQVLGAYYISGKAYGNLVLQATLPEAKGLGAWLVLFLENVLPLAIAVDLIQWKKLGSWKSNLAEARFEFPTVLIRKMTVEAMRLLLRPFCEKLNPMKEARDGW